MDSETDMTENELIESTEAGEWISVGSLDERRQFWQQAAGGVVEGKKRRISVSIAERDLAMLKTKALEQGLSYKTLINAILHKYVS